MWPFPNEDLIKTKMAAYNNHGVSGARGFCTGTSIDGTAQTLTKYIWEYLGNQIPSSIYTTTPSSTVVISGYCKNNSSTTLSGITVSLSGGSSSSTITASDGSFSFTMSTGQSYTITPTLTQWTFAPVSASTATVEGNVSYSFWGTFTPSTATISGYCYNNSTQTMAGVDIAFTGSSIINTTTDGSGYFSITVSTGTTYTVTPMLTNWTFAPVSVSMATIVSNVGYTFWGNSITPVSPLNLQGLTAQGVKFQ